MSDAPTANVPTTRARVARRTPLFEYWWVPFWAFTPFVAALYSKAWLLPGEDSKFWPTVFWLPILVFLCGVFGTLLHLAVVGGERLRLVKYATACAVLGIASTWGLWRLERSWFLPLLVDVRFAKADIPAGVTSHEFIQGGALYGTGAWVRALEYTYDGEAVVRHRDREHRLAPDLQWSPTKRRFSCPAYDGWYYVFWWDT